MSPMPPNAMSMPEFQRQTSTKPLRPNPMDLCSFKTIMAANRGEIAVRIFRAATELNMKTVAVYAHEDRHGTHRWNADESYCLPANGTPVGSYLNIDGIIKVAKDAGVDAIHPGYGFLAESAEFAQACNDNKITFIGPRVEHLDIFGDKTKAKELAISAGVSVVPGTDGAVTNPQQAEDFVDKYGLPVMIKAAKGGGGKGMRVVRTREELIPLFNAAASEALASFGDGSCFIERYVGSAKHVEVQVLGDGKGNVVHLWERDCSIQRRHQKLIEIAPAWHHSSEVRKNVQEDALKLTRACKYLCAGTVEFLVDENGRHYFMEVNPRVQVEHTVTEEVTNIDIVQSTFLIAGGATFKQLGLDQDTIIPVGIAMQCRITTEDPAKDFAPDTGMLDVCRHSTGPGIRIDGCGYAGMVIQPYFDSLLVKYTAKSSTWEGVVRRMHRTLIENHIRGVKNNIPFLLNVLAHPEFMRGNFDLNFIEQNPKLLDTTPVPGRKSQCYQKLDDLEGHLKYIANLAVNGHPSTLGANPEMCLKLPISDVPFPNTKAIKDILSNKKLEGVDTPSFRKILRENGALALANAVRNHPRLLVTDTTWRDAHQSILATRMRTKDLVIAAEATNVAFTNADVFSEEMWGGATFDVSMRFLHECPWERLEKLRTAAPDVCFQMLLRGANAVGYTSYPDNLVYAFCKQAYESGIDIFRVFDSLNYTGNMELGIKAAVAAGGFVEAAICYTGDVTNISADNKYNLQYYLKYADELVELGAHALAVKDMAGLLTPRAVKMLVGELRKKYPKLPIHLHTHDTAGMGVSAMIAGADAGADIVDGAIDSMSGLSSQPCLGAIVAAVGTEENHLDLEALQVLNQYWESKRNQYSPFEVPQLSSAIGSNVYMHEIPGGQYTNLLFQSQQLGLSGRFGEVKKAYQDANKLMGDIPKVTPSSKVVGDLAQFMISLGVTAEDVLADADKLPLPNSVIEYFQGAMGPPPGGFPEPLRSKILKGRLLPDGQKCFEGRPGAELPDYDFDGSEKMLKEAFGESRISFKDLLSHALYPDVFKEWLAFEKIYGSISELPSNVFLRPMKTGEEVEVIIGKGKEYFIRVSSIDQYDETTGTRAVSLEVNGERWFIRTPDEVTPLKLAAGCGGTVNSARKEKCDPTNKGHLGCPMPGVIVDVLASDGDTVEEGETLFKLSAMKMETDIKAPIAGTIKKIYVESQDNVDGDDLLAKIE